MKAQFLDALNEEGSISEPALSVASLGKSYGPLQKQVADSVERQKTLIEDIQVGLFEYNLLFNFSYLLFLTTY